MVRVKDVMRTDVVTADPEASVADIARIMSNNKLGSVVIKELDSEKPLGIITWSAIVTFIGNGRDPKQTKAKNLMGKNLVTVDQSTPILEVAKMFVKSNIDRMPVVNGGNLVGLLSYKDILATTPQLIEILSEKLKATADRPPRFHSKISGMCEECGNYSDYLLNTLGRWVCEVCKE